VRCTHGGRGQVVKGFLIRSAVALKCIPESEKTTHWTGVKKPGFFQTCLYSNLLKLIDISYFLFLT